jgi:hypothetical protein
LPKIWSHISPIKRTNSSGINGIKTDKGGIPHGLGDSDLVRRGRVRIVCGRGGRTGHRECPPTPELPREQGVPSHSQEDLDAEDADEFSSPEVPAGGTGSSGSNSIDNGWSERIKTAALEHSLPEKVVSQEPAAVIQELQGALRETANGFFPQARLDEIYEHVLSYLVSEDHTTKDKRQRNRGRGRRAIRRYVYARTQDLFKRNPGQLAQHVREDVRWLGDDQTQLQRDDIERLYQTLWNHKPKVQHPHWDFLPL